MNKLTQGSRVQGAFNIAFKCTYNNGDEGDFVGFNGTCTKNIIEWNIEHGRRWCSYEKCGCRKYYDRNFKGRKPTEPCYESTLFSEWRYGAGRCLSGKRAGTPFHIRKNLIGKIAVLTTRFPREPEKDRRIIGFFRVGNVSNDPETIVEADETFRVRLPMDIAKELKFWEYYTNTKGSVLWRQGLFRYLDDEQVVSMLTDIKNTLRDEDAKIAITELLRTDFSTAKPSFRKNINLQERIATLRKYGSGGEGEAHKKLKHAIYEKPALVGLYDVKDSKEEYSFKSGDRADIHFELQGGTFAVVEVETVNPLPGVYQALKYKVLKCAELEDDITSPKVKAVVVAWFISEKAKRLCARYGIRWVEKKLPKKPD